MNAVLIAVLVMLILSVARVHVVISLFIGALVGGLISGIGLGPTMVAFQDGLAGGAKIALSYALLGAFAMAVASSGLPTLLARWIMSKIGNTEESANRRAVLVTKWLMVAGVLAMAIMSQNLIPVHIAFIPLIIPPLLGVMNKLRIDRRLIACVLTFGLVTTYMWIPVGFGSIFLNEILLGNIRKAGLDTTGINIMQVMSIPALGMIAGLIIAVGFSYRKPRDYENRPLEAAHSVEEVTRYKVIVAIIAILATFIVQVVMQLADSEADSLLIGALTGLAVFLVTGAVNWKEADDVFTSGMKMMALIGFIMITAQGFAAVMTATGQVETLVDASAALFGSNKAMGALVMLIVGLIVTMGIGSSFSTLPIIATIYVPLCLALGFSPAATVAIVGAAGALGDAGSPASDSTLGPTAGLNADGQHDHIRDSVIPTFLHYNLPLIVSGWVAAMVL
ncbi:Na+/H+ antiporter family protein [Corynebacterium matruchotii]|jgi:Na+/H+ antiporter family protein|uniref:Na+/H+ antiporter family protein n=3 Tax=Corynebacterium matruchotii TaxID=43768 RepID=E0DG87_9CORY|nr:Na+/H+ antiporter NhaC family protein [Corynebacterium matruchotii]EEG26610.1 Na+/H+ antiporter family protein [Corynebacterium matruchotii ATCC 33806]EFM48746.1 Na+/H+ antiporter family protein [Corynebacterium matruchotii ATCC 14266]KAB1925736.1 TRAP transporter large permease subunit [Corynebacterium matruchotii]QIP44551.1 TRAP transporter large permease subunit [Corynebacterium matruchotii]SPW27686.1 Na+/H+ antiporter NhaC [Corynebacterium matruchotii]